MLPTTFYGNQKQPLITYHTTMHLQVLQVSNSDMKMSTVNGVVLEATRWW